MGRGEKNNHGHNRKQQKAVKRFKKQATKRAKNNSDKQKPQPKPQRQLQTTITTNRNCNYSHTPNPQTTTKTTVKTSMTENKDTFCPLLKYHAELCNSRLHPLGGRLAAEEVADFGDYRLIITLFITVSTIVGAFVGLNQPSQGF